MREFEFNGKKYIKDGSHFYDENHLLLSKAEEYEVCDYYFNGLDNKKKPSPKPDSTNKPTTSSKKKYIDYLEKDEKRTYGTDSRDIYLTMCDQFDWKKELADKFGNWTYLFAKEATKEGYAVWFLRHSENWTHSKGGDWRNNIFHNRIEEIWEKTTEDPDDHEEKDIRVVFAFNKSGYAFIGVYQFEKSEPAKNPYDGSPELKKTYRLISERYPLK